MSQGGNVRAVTDVHGFYSGFKSKVAQSYAYRLIFILGFQVSNVVCNRRGSSDTGTLHLTAHHLIFCPTKPNGQELRESTPNSGSGEVWVSNIIYILLTIFRGLLDPVSSHQSSHQTTTNNPRTCPTERTNPDIHILFISVFR